MQIQTQEEVMEAYQKQHIQESLLRGWSSSARAISLSRIGDPLIGGEFTATRSFFNLIEIAAAAGARFDDIELTIPGKLFLKNQLKFIERIKHLKERGLTAVAIDLFVFEQNFEDDEGTLLDKCNNALLSLLECLEGLKIRLRTSKDGIEQSLPYNLNHGVKFSERPELPAAEGKYEGCIERLKFFQERLNDEQFELLTMTDAQREVADWYT